ncbi:3-deoxy-8-phosphooctulonate synthase [Aneurinibacillus uraniidurans]|uniref:3-deoxy-8-phosphooctulonate synthase n=1 Tax=Aneurinibacillus uraniidurans TaxID=2966586 RepID=UPI002349D91C|nr:3-deoxy-8-phosphooctulonate synthase [Aneurinibacillus sp. B1]WCN38807.1 3-deoxy-8-phosphooctulonate synthase [Aneurinibacillus sp. B1]
MKPIVYNGFPLMMETETDGYIYGEITDHFNFDYEEDESCTSGDGFVQAPDGSRAGIIWGVEEEPYLSVCIESEEDRWGVYNVGFVKPIKTIDDLIFNFKTVLPLIKGAYNSAKFDK